MRKYLIGLVVIVAMAVAGFKIYSAYQATQPPYAVGECLDFQTQGIPVRIEITDNVQEKQVSVVIVRYDFFGEYIYQAGAASYQELREIVKEYDAKKVSCEKDPQ